LRAEVCGQTEALKIKPKEKNTMTKFRYLRISTFRVLILYAASATGQNSTPQAAPQPCATVPQKHGPLGKIHLPGQSNPNSTVNRACANWGICLSDPNQSIGVPGANAKPCPTGTPDSKPQAPAPVPPVAAPEPASEPIISDDGKLLYICPKGSTKAPEYPICERDGNVFPMIAMPLPPVGGPKKMHISDGPGAVNAKPGTNANSLSQPVTGTTQNQNPASGAQK
jgi:hypothetical protein